MKRRQWQNSSILRKMIQNNEVRSPSRHLSVMAGYSLSSSSPDDVAPCPSLEINLPSIAQTSRFNRTRSSPACPRQPWLSSRFGYLPAGGGIEPDLPDIPQKPWLLSEGPDDWPYTKPPSTALRRSARYVPDPRFHSPPPRTACGGTPALD
jgi:hypothetical protein